MIWFLFIKDIFFNGFKITRYEANNIDINERKDVRMSWGRKFSDSSYSESFQVVNKNDFWKILKKKIYSFWELFLFFVILSLNLFGLGEFKLWKLFWNNI